MALFQGAATLAIDLGRTHASNPYWPGHARFHVAWHSVNVALLTLLAEYVLWTGTLPETTRFHAGLLLTTLPMLGFLAALCCRSAYGGTLSDCGGMPLLQIRYRGRRREVDMNLLAVIGGLTVAITLLLVHDFRA